MQNSKKVMVVTKKLELKYTEKHAIKFMFKKWRTYNENILRSINEGFAKIFIYIDREKGCFNSMKEFLRSIINQNEMED